METEAQERYLEPTPPILAAVDLGSNSFKMVIARVVNGELRPLDQERGGVRLAAYLDSKQRLTTEGRHRALRCLRKFGQRLREFPQSQVRAVGTNTLRRAHDSSDFLSSAEEALGHPIEVISSQEEARLTFLGASHSLAGGPGRRLVADIGGGSTELVVGDGFRPSHYEGLYMGCVSYTLAFFPEGKISAKRMAKAETAARLELRHIHKKFRELGWDTCAGAAGTIGAVAEVLRLSGWHDQGITPWGLGKLREAILAVDHVDQLILEGLKSDRAKVLPGGVAILNAIFESLGIERMTKASGGLREGVLFDLESRRRHQDVRDRTIQRLIAQYQVDVPQARRVEATALRLLGQVAESWDLDAERSRAFLAWGASLHEIGLSVAHGGFHKHGAYLIRHSDMPGFSVQDQKELSMLVRGVRRKFPKDDFEQFARRSESTELKVRRLCVLLRLAYLLNRNRSSRPLPQLRLTASKRKLRLEFPEDWLDAHPLTVADLQQERKYLKAAGIKLQILESD